jgi:hypothetical protein
MSNAILRNALLLLSLLHHHHGGTCSAAATRVSAAACAAFWTDAPRHVGGESAIDFNETLALIAAHQSTISEVIVGQGVKVGANGSLGAAVPVGSWLLPRLRAAAPAARLVLAIGTESGVSGAALAEQLFANASLVQALADVASQWGADGLVLDLEDSCAVGCEECSCDAAWADSIADVLQRLAAPLHAVGKTIAFTTNQKGAGYLHLKYFPQYLAAGVDRLLEMGSYGGTPRDFNVTRAVLAAVPPAQLARVSFGACPLADCQPKDASGQRRGYYNATRLTAWIDELLQPAAAAHGVGLHVYDLAGFARPSHLPNFASSPPDEWWPVLRRFACPA